MSLLVKLFPTDYCTYTTPSQLIFDTGIITPPKRVDCLLYKRLILLDLELSTI